MSPDTIKKYIICISHKTWLNVKSLTLHKQPFIGLEEKPEGKCCHKRHNSKNGFWAFIKKPPYLKSNKNKETKKIRAG